MLSSGAIFALVTPFRARVDGIRGIILDPTTNWRVIHDGVRLQESVTPVTSSTMRFEDVDSDVPIRVESQHTRRIPYDLRHYRNQASMVMFSEKIRLENEVIILPALGW